MRIIAFFLLASLAATSPAEIYRSVAPDGSVVFTDQAIEGAQPVPMPQWPVPAPLAAPALSTPPSETAQRPFYELVWLERPTPNENIRDQGEGLEVKVATKPELAADKGHAILIFVDGKPQGKGTPAQTQRVFDIERGPHTVSTQVLDGDGKVLIESRPVRFFYQRPSHFSTAPDYVPSEGPVKAAPRAPRAPIAPRAPNVPVAPIAPIPSAGN